MDNVRSLTLSYTFVTTGEAAAMDSATEFAKREAASAAARSQLAKLRAGGAGGAEPPPAAASSESIDAVRRWTEATAARIGKPLAATNSASATAAVTTATATTA